MYLLQSPKGQAFNLSFEVFNLEARFHDYCMDYVEISNGTDSRKFCGSQIPGPFINIIGENLTLRFKTDSSGNEEGFIASVCCSVNVTMYNYNAINSDGGGDGSGDPGSVEQGSGETTSSTSNTGEQNATPTTTTTATSTTTTTTTTEGGISKEIHNLITEKEKLVLRQVRNQTVLELELTQSRGRIRSTQIM